MSKKPSKSDPLRTAAEAQLARVPETKVQPQPGGELLHELQVHQIELEMQNEQLRRAQVALEESRDRYVGLYEFAPVGYLTLTETGMISEINLTGATLLKTERNKLLHHRFSPFVAPEHRDRWSRLFVSVLQERGVKNCELALKNSDGESFQVYLDCTHLIADGSPVLRITLTDITSLRHAEESMREWQAFVECSTWGMSIGDIDSRMIRRVNPAYARMHGYTVEELHGIKADAMYAPESRANLPSYVERVRKDGHHTFECVRLRKDGSTFPAEVSISMVDGVDGKTTSMVSVKDITGCKQAEEELRTSEQKFMRLFMLVPIPLGVVNKDGVIVYFNDQITKVFGYTTDDVPTLKEWWQLAYPDESYRQRVMESWGAAVAKAAKEGTDIEPAEYRVTCKSGAERIVMIGGSIIEESVLATFIDITERKQAEESLKNMASKYRTVFESSSDAIMLLDEKGFFDCNPATLRMFGCATRDEFISKHPAEISPPIQPGGEDSMSLANQLIATAFKNGSNQFEWIHRRPDGADFPVEVLLTAMELEGRQVLQATVRDITARKNAEDKLAENEQHFRAVTESANDAIISGDSVGNIVGWNAAAERLFGYTEAEMIGQPLTLLMPEHFCNPHSAGLARVVAGGTPHLIGKTVEVFGLRKDGSEFPLELSLAQWDAADGKFITAIIRDITERKRAEDSLRKLSLAVEQNPGSIVITDLDANIEYVNAAFVKATGYSLAEAIGQNPRILHSGKTPKASYDDLWAHLTRGEVWKGEFINKRKDGSEYIEAVLISPVRQPDGRVTNYLAIKEDITEHKQAEAKLAEQVDDLRRWHDATIGREMRVLDLKHEVNELLGQAGQPLRYPSAESDDPQEK